MPLGGDLIKGPWFGRYDVAPPILVRKVFADTAQNIAERNNYSVNDMLTTVGATKEASSSCGFVALASFSVYATPGCFARKLAKSVQHCWVKV